MVLPLLTVLAIAVAALLVWLNPFRERGGDDMFPATVLQPMLTEQKPLVLFDEGHRNLHSIGGRYGAFARLLRAEGCSVLPLRSRFTPESLARCQVLVVVNAAGADGKENPAFSTDEEDAIERWIRDGGSLLLVADHHPYGPASAPLAARFGVVMQGGWTEDVEHARAGAGDPGQILFTRANGLLGEHSILSTPVEGATINTVETFTGQSLTGPPDAVVLLRLGEGAKDQVPTGEKEVTHEGGSTKTTFTTDLRSAAGHAQGLALRVGKGRVVVLGEAAMLTAQIADDNGTRFGMNSADNDNRLLVLNIVRWLACAIDGGA